MSWVRIDDHAHEHRKQAAAGEGGRVNDNWTTISFADFMADIRKAESESRGGSHHYIKRKRLPWPYCAKCGLLCLRNAATQKAERAGCYR